MTYRNVKYFCLSLILSAATSFCFGAEAKQDQEENKLATYGTITLPDSTEKRDVTPSQILHLMSLSYNAECTNHSNTLKQAQSFENIFTMLKSIMSDLTDTDVTECEGLMCWVLKNQAVVLNNYVQINCKDYSSNSYELTRKALTLLRQSYQLCKKMIENGSIFDKNIVKNHELADQLYSFSQVSYQHAKVEKNHSDSLALFAESIDCLQECQILDPTVSTKPLLHDILCCSMEKFMQIYRDTNDDFQKHLQITDITMKLYTLFINNADLTKKILDYMNNYIMKSPLNFKVLIDSGFKRMLGNKKGRGNEDNNRASYIPSTYKDEFSLLNPHDFIRLPWTTYCGALHKASLIINTLSATCNNEVLAKLYLERAQKNAHNAFSFYKENVYHGQYNQNTETEQAFIQAQLNDIAGNPTPLNEFYRALHQRRREKQSQKIVEMIKTQQNLHHQEEKKRRKQAIEKSQQKMEGEVKSLYQEESTDEPASFLEITTAVTNQSPVVRETPQETISKKTKRRGIANSPLLPANDTLNVEPGRNKLFLSPNDHHVFHSLTGGVLNRNISLQQVKTLLASPAIGCKITTHNSGSSHAKATAPNGKMWTIPKAWDGPIPAYYRLQLNDFFQEALEIDPEDVILT
jgi:hypothetical protein